MTTLLDQIDRVIAQSRQTGMSIQGGYMPHSPVPTPREIAFGLQRTCGWKVSEMAVRAALDARNA